MAVVTLAACRIETSEVFLAPFASVDYTLDELKNGGGKFDLAGPLCKVT